MSKTDDVRAFHEAVGLEVGGAFGDDDLRWLRRKLIDEEVDELFDANEADRPVEYLDALVDLVYVSIGAAVSYGWDFDEAWRRVHESNMAKLGPNGEVVRREDGKVLKPAGWTPPHLDELVREEGSS